MPYSELMRSIMMPGLSGSHELNEFTKLKRAKKLRDELENILDEIENEHEEGAEMTESIASQYEYIRLSLVKIYCIINEIRNYINHISTNYRSGALSSSFEPTSVFYIP